VYDCDVKRTTITLPDDLARAAEAFRESQTAPPSLTSILQSALRSFLSERGYWAEQKRLQISPAPRGSGMRDVSAEHDRYLARK
jgi:hypothetical protein